MNSSIHSRRKFVGLLAAASAAALLPQSLLRAMPRKDHVVMGRPIYTEVKMPVVRRPFYEAQLRRQAKRKAKLAAKRNLALPKL